MEPNPSTQNDDLSQLISSISEAGSHDDILKVGMLIVNSVRKLLVSMREDLASLSSSTLDIAPLLNELAYVGSRDIRAKLTNLALLSFSDMVAKISSMLMHLRKSPHSNDDAVSTNNWSSIQKLSEWINVMSTVLSVLDEAVEKTIAVPEFATRKFSSYIEINRTKELTHHTLEALGMLPDFEGEQRISDSPRLEVMVEDNPEADEQVPADLFPEEMRPRVHVPPQCPRKGPEKADDDYYIPDLN